MKKSIMITIFLATILLTTICDYKVVKADVSCPIALLTLVPCIPYVTDKQDQPGAECCNGASRVIDMAKTKDDLRALCECLKNVAARASGVDFTRVAALPALCSVSLPFTITPDIDCSKL